MNARTGLRIAQAIEPEYAWSPMTPMRDLAAAVIRRAVLDLVRTEPCSDCGKPMNECAASFLMGGESLDLWTALTPATSIEEARKWALSPEAREFVREHLKARKRGGEAKHPVKVQPPASLEDLDWEEAA